MLNWTVVTKVVIKSIKMAAVRWNKHQLKYVEPQHESQKWVCMCV